MGGQDWAHELINHTDQVLTEAERRQRGLGVLADELQTMAGRVRILAPYAPGCGIPDIVGEMGKLAERLRRL